MANGLAAVVLGRSLNELSPQARKLLRLLTEMVHGIAARERLEPHAVRFTRRTVRHFTGWTDFQVRAHLGQLQSLEYVLAHHGMRGQLYVYELLYLDDDRGDRTSTESAAEAVNALNLREYGANVEESRGHVEHPNGENEGASSPDRGPIEPAVRRPPIAPIVCVENALGNAAALSAKKNTNGANPGRHRTIPAGEP